ncbi:hypothetical protein [Polaribacter sp.]|uniref:hypothetical protein n=1 Tax=Polaribacter sp. TaxID=1920175 RepID=UPI003EF4214F
MKEEFKQYLIKNNKKGSQKASSYLRAIDLLDNILKKETKIIEQKSIYDVNSVKIIATLYKFVLKEQKKEKGVFENEEPISYWRNGFYPMARICNPLPQSFEDLTGEESYFLTNTSLISELKWFFEVFSHYKKQLDQFLVIQNKIETDVLLGNISKVDLCIEEMEDKISNSL